MSRILGSVISPLFLTLSVSAIATAADRWPQWRGEDQRGVAAGEDFPVRWSEGEGVTWKLELPGIGGSTPVVEGSSAYLTTGHEGSNRLLAIDVSAGKVRWTIDLGKDRGNKHAKGSGSNPSPVLGEEGVYAYFRSGDLACVDRAGKRRWSTNLQDRFGADELWWDLGNSPVLTRRAVVVVVMQTAPSASYLAAFDQATGDLLWKVDRELGAPSEAAQSYTTPVVTEIDGKEVIAVMGADHLTLHDAADGELLGKLGGFNPTGEQFFRSIASPVASGDLIVCPYARGATVTCVDMKQLAAGRGEESIVWFRDDLGSDVPTPSIDRGRVYLVNDGKSARGTVHALDLRSGKTVWEVRLPGSRKSFSASPLVAGNHLYVTREDAVTFVVGPLDAPQPALVAENVLADDAQYTVSSPVPAGDALLLRSRNFLHLIVGD